MLHLKLLGGAEVRVDDVSVAGRLPAKAQAILYYLALARQPQPRTVLAPLLWGDMPEESARTSLRKAISSLRQELGDLLAIDRQSVAFNPATQPRVDAVEFETLLDESPVKKAPAELQAAVDLYRGDFLTGFYVRGAPDFEAWMLAEQGRLRELMVQALFTLAAHFAEGGELARGITTVRRLLALEPWREEAHRQLMRLLAQDGQRGAALAQYETCRQTLAAELGVDPGRETTALYERIRRGQLDQEPALTERFAPPPVSQGEVLPPALPRPDPPAARPLQTVRYLPVQATPFVGREKELADIIRRLTDRDCRLLTLVGPGGIGKTRLALQTAQTFLDTGAADDFFPHGLVFVPLVGVTSPGGLLPAIAGAAKFSFYGSIPPRQQLLDHLQEKKLLLILDNLEHVLAGGTELIAAILAAAPAVKVLVTSREALNLQEAWFHPVQGMPFPAGDPPPTAAEKDKAAGPPLESYDAVRLFVQSAGRTRVNFSLARERAHVIRICRLVEGMPLALELAAAWLKVLPAEKIAREIERNLDFLATRHHNVPARHHSIRAVFEHSWQLLAPEQRDVLRRLSVFRSSFTEEAAAQVAGASLPILALLVEKSLLRVDAGGSYQMHELTRQYAAEQLAAVPTVRLTSYNRHCAYYADFAAGRAQAMDAGRRMLRVIGEVTAEWENLQAAWFWAIEQGNVEAIQKLSGPLYSIYQDKSRYQEGLDTLNSAVTLLHRLPPSEQQAAVLAETLVYQGWLSIRLGQLEKAQAAFEQSRALYLRYNLSYPPLASTDPLIGLGTLANTRGNYAEAEALGEESRRLHTTLGDKRNLQYAFYVLMNAAYARGAYEDARRYGRQAYTLSQELEARREMALFLHDLGKIAMAMGDYGPARQFFQDSYTISQALNNPEGVAVTLNHLGGTALALGQYQEAANLFRQSLAHYRGFGDQGGLAAALKGLGQVACAQGDLPAAGRYLRQALQISTAIGFDPLTLAILAVMGELFLPRGLLEQGHQLLSLVAHHPASDHLTRGRVQALLRRYELDLSPAVLARTVRPEQPGDLHQVVAELQALLADLERE